MSGILEVKRLTKQFGGLTAVDDVSFSVAEGSIAGLIGPNGAGKTTVFNLITGIYKVTAGEITFEGKPVHNLDPHIVAEMGVTRTFQNIRLFRRLSVRDNILTACHGRASYSVADSILHTAKYRDGERRLAAESERLMALMNLTDVGSSRASGLPYGLQRRLEIARALAVRPRLILLDEPAAGMNPDETMQLMALISRIRDEFGCTVLVIEHRMDLIMGICENIMVLNFGRKLAEGPPEAVQNDAAVIEAYLGAHEGVAAHA